MFARNSLSRHDDLEGARRGFAAQRLEAVHPRVRLWLGDAAVAAAIDDELSQALGWCFDRQRAARTRHMCPIAGLNEQAYCARMLEAPDGRRVLVELRFKGLRPDEAFVELLACDFELTSGAMSALLTACRAQFRRARPRWLRVYVGSHLDLHPELDELPWAADQHLLVGHMSTLKRPARADALEARPVDATCFSRYAAAYDAFATSAPALAAEVERIEQADIARQVEHGVAREVFVGGRWAGYVAAMPEPFMGSPAYCIYEELLAPEYRGRGFGAALQWKLIDALPADALLWGTIHERNAPSLATAVRIGRVDVGHYRLFDL